MTQPLTKKSGRKSFTPKDVLIVLHRKTKRDPITGCLNWRGYKDRDGYGTIGYQGNVYRVHRLLYALLVSEIPKGLVLRHSCDNPSCVELEHLSLGTAQENDADRVARDRQAKGEWHGRAKLTAAQVLEIRALHKAGQYTQAMLSEQFKIGKTQIARIVNSQSWRHLS